ncbi:DUF2062 domain-containing protein [Desulfovibrio psychrotolerans]|uniref:DUF2062 domain-containing protein n=1 Tax=Desulfovibrio psychrotolerans TaxID=415242 RepID=A0A7J0BPF7_9BACT|nr:DUF2062 domain-containing protein [Desulfovibrio psychrotolerans]GFM35586.1 hypothetical protein DSM19430T_02700 [Desulfovibrio psychrotolerans]
MQRWESFKRIFRFNYLKLLRLKATTHSIAIGLAVGVLVGFMPIIPFQTVVAVALAFLVRGSKIPAAIGTWVSNPVNVIPFYSLMYYVGKAVLPFDVPRLDFRNLELEAMIQQGWGLVLTMFAGGMLMGIPAAFLTYVLSFKAVHGYRQKRMIRLIKKYQLKQGNREGAEAAGTLLQTSGSVGAEQAPDGSSSRAEVGSTGEGMGAGTDGTAFTGANGEARRTPSQDPTP